MVFDAKMFVSKTVSFFPHSHRSYWFDKHKLESNRSQSCWIHKYGLRPKLLSVKCCKRPWNWFTVNLCCICLFLCFQSSSAGDCPAWSWFPVCTVGALGHCRTKVMSSCVDTLNGQCVLQLWHAIVYLKLLFLFRGEKWYRCVVHTRADTDAIVRRKTLITTLIP